MSRYLADDCEWLRKKYIDRIDDALYHIKKDYDEMDFENIYEKKSVVRSELDVIKSQLENARQTISAKSFE